jgi:FkbM family methyltransferase
VETLEQQVINIAHHREVMLCDSDDQFIGRQVLRTGEFEFGLVQRVLDILGHRRVLVDIGANIGTVCVPAVCRDMVESAVAVEPDPYNFKLLRCNTILNDVDDRIVCIQAAAGDRSDIVDLALNETNFGDHQVGAKSSRRSIPVEMVLAQSLLDVTDDDVVWLDVQGSEVIVLDGWPMLLERRIPLVIEVWPEMLEANKTADRLIAHLSRYDTFMPLQSGVDPMPVSGLGAYISSIAQGAHQDFLMGCA